MGKHEVTERQLAVQRMAAGRTAAPAHAASAVLPARRVSWEEARAYAAWAGLRLPTRAEWTRAALGDDGRPFPWGEAEPGPPRVNTPPARQGGQLVLGAGDHGRPEAVTARPAGASPVGCLHMIGNVAEWVADVDPARPALRLHMGGSFRAPVDRALGATFALPGPDDAVGLRVCR
ncbi:MAG: SUMF1/EgtB/PvdO family nonheme iron enzyme [Planctomycetes bacterium]|nr:SUMF1/EgtB/PvdO family nonheme iron enzyme [Planctomycetota bacterium]